MDKNIKDQIIDICNKHEFDVSFDEKEETTGISFIALDKNIGTITVYVDNNDKDIISSLSNGINSMSRIKTMMKDDEIKVLSESLTASQKTQDFEQSIKFSSEIYKKITSKTKMQAKYAGLSNDLLLMNLAQTLKSSPKKSHSR